MDTAAKALTITQGSNMWEWLNAYNAPHWMKLGSIAGWSNTQTKLPSATAIETYGTSWISDLMAAKGLVSIPGLWQGRSTFSGATDANHGYTPFGHASHDLGMAMDLGILQHVTDQKYQGNTPSAYISQITGQGVWNNSLAATFASRMINASQDTKRKHDRAFSDFALLYSATIKGSAGSRDSLVSRIKGSNTQQNVILDALFGNGTQTGSIVNGVLIGGTANKTETYPDIRYALRQMGFRVASTPTWNTMPTVKNGGPHYNHYHIYLQPPKVSVLTPPKALMASAVNPLNVANASSSKAVQKISPDIVRKIERETLKECAEAENQSSKERLGIPGGDMGPARSVLALLKFNYHIEPVGEVVSTIIRSPSHGTVVRVDGRNPSYPHVPKFDDYVYSPAPNFYGTDHVDFQVTVNGKTFRVSYKINVLDMWDNGESCRPEGEDRGELLPLDQAIQYSLGKSKGPGSQ